MMTDDDRRFDTPFNVVAAFRAEPEARRAVDTLVRKGVPGEAIHLAEPGSDSELEEWAEERAELQDELDESWPVTGMAVMTRSQAKGALVGSLVFGAVGLVLGLGGGAVWALWPSSLGALDRVAIAGLFGFVAFTTVGFIAGGGFNPRFETADDLERDPGDRRMEAERDFLVAVHVQERQVAEAAARVLGDSGAQQVHCADATGTPLPPQAKHPRPADPPGWWWRRAGRG